MDADDKQYKTPNQGTFDNKSVNSPSKPGLTPKRPTNMLDAMKRRAGKVC